MAWVLVGDSEVTSDNYVTLEKMGTRVEDGESRIYLFLLLVQRSDETTPEKMAYSLEQDKLSPCIIT
jgi:hypothetical protein